MRQQQAAGRRQAARRPPPRRRALCLGSAGGCTRSCPKAGSAGHELRAGSGQWMDGLAGNRGRRRPSCPSKTHTTPSTHPPHHHPPTTTHLAEVHHGHKLRRDGQRVELALAVEVLHAAAGCLGEGGRGGVEWVGAGLGALGTAGGGSGARQRPERAGRVGAPGNGQAARRPGTAGCVWGWWAGGRARRGRPGSAVQARRGASPVKLDADGLLVDLVHRVPAGSAHVAAVQVRVGGRTLAALPACGAAHSCAPAPAAGAQRPHRTTLLLVARTPSVIQKLLMNWVPGRRCAVRSAGQPGGRGRAVRGMPMRAPAAAGRP